MPSPPQLKALHEWVFLNRELYLYAVYQQTSDRSVNGSFRGGKNKGEA
jgi:hypothetical protein